MKVLLCSPTQPIGGISKWTGYIIDHFSTDSVPNMTVELFPMNNKTYLGESASALARIKQGVAAYSRVISHFFQILKSSSPDVVHVCSSGSFGLLRDYIILRKCRKQGAKTCIHFHFGRIPDILKKHNWEYFLLRRVMAMADCIIVMNQESYDALNAIGTTKVENIPNPLSPHISDLVDRISAVRETNKLVYVGHILPTKGIKELIESVMSSPNVRLTLVGADTMNLEQQLQIEFPEALLSKKIMFLGQQSHEKVIEEMKTGIFVFPSYSEGFPNVILESMACGVPIIASEVGSIPEMLDKGGKNQCGLLVPPQNSTKLTEAIKYAIENPIAMNKMGLTAQKRVCELYNIETVGSHLTRCWMNVFSTT